MSVFDILLNYRQAFLQGLYVTVQLATPEGAAAPEQQESAYERVIRTGTIRCGYVSFDPYMRIDSKTGERSGITYDIMNEIGEKLGLEVKWTEEVGWANFIEGLKNKRYDMVCTGGWPVAREGKHVGYSIPLYFEGGGVYVRQADTRTIEELNKPGVTAVGTDGSLDAVFAQKFFPKADVVNLPNLTDKSHVLMEVATGKADFTLQSIYRGNLYMGANPGELKNLTPNPPLWINHVALIMPLGETKLKEMIDTAVMELHNGGFIKNTLAKYTPQNAATFYPVNQLYGNPVPADKYDDKTPSQQNK